MQPVRIESPDDPRVRDFRNLSDGELLARRGWFVAEGRLVVQRVLEDPRYTVRSLLLSPAAFASVEPVLRRATDIPPVYVCNTADFLGITGFNIHRGCLALVQRPRPIAAAELIASARALVILEGVANADNIGGVFRNAAAFGVDGVILSPGCADPLYRKAVRTSMAASVRIPFALLEPWPDGLQHVSGAGFTIVALTPRPEAEPLEHFASRPRPARLALLVGAEGSGLTDAAAAHAQPRVRIPTRPEVDSLNLAVAAGIALSRLLGDRIF